MEAVEAVLLHHIAGPPGGGASAGQAAQADARGAQQHGALLEASRAVLAALGCVQGLRPVAWLVQATLGPLHTCACTLHRAWAHALCRALG